MLEVSAYLPHRGEFWLVLPSGSSLEMADDTSPRSSHPGPTALVYVATGWPLGIPENGGIHSTVLWEGHGEDSLGFPKAHSH